MTTPPLLDHNEKQARTWNMLCHLSALIGLFPVVPFGNILGPLIIWQIKKNEIPSVEEHGKESFNFQLSITLYLLVGGVGTVFLIFFCIGWLFVPVLVLIWLAGIVFSIIAAIKANNGENYTYPFTIRFVS